MAFVPAGKVCATTVTLTLPVNTNLWIGPGGSLKATATITSHAVVETPVSTITVNPEIYGGGKIDANNLADQCLWIHQHQGVRIHDLNLANQSVYALHLGDNGQAYSYEAKVHDLEIYRDGTHNAVAGSVGIYLDNAGDSYIGPSNVMVAQETGISATKDGSTFIDNHVWAVSGLLTAFYDNGSGQNVWVSDYADTPTTYGFHFGSSADNESILGGRIYNNSSGADNTMIGIRIDNAGPSNYSIVGVSFFGQTSSNRIATDISFAGSQSNVFRYGNMDANVVTSNGSPFFVYINNALELGGTVSSRSNHTVDYLGSALVTISSGFGTSPSVFNQNGTATFTIGVGTGGTATSGVISLPSTNVAAGWNVHCQDVTTHTIQTVQTATTTGTATLASFNFSGASTAWGSADNLICWARAY